MDKVSLNIIVPDVPNNGQHKTTGSIDVNTIVSIKKSHDYTTSFNSDVLIKIRKDKREKLLDTYLKYFTSCIDRIKLLNNKNSVDLFFEVPHVVPECGSYLSSNCIDFISDKLKSLHFDTLKINSFTLFVTWKYLEVNKENAKKKP